MTDQKAHLSIDGIDEAIELPIFKAALGPSVLDVRGLTAKGLFTYDPGFVSTASCDSAITYIDGGQGILLHRGYPIDQLAEKSDYLETCYLLFNGELPNAEQKAEFVAKVLEQMPVSENVANVIKAFDPKSHPMAMMIAAMGVLAAECHDDMDIENAECREAATISLVAKLPTVTAMCYKQSQGEAFIAPSSDLSYAENFLNMTFGTAGKAADVSPILAQAMDRIFTLHADHEQNASTSTVRLAGSSGTNPFAAIAAGIATLWGPSHGGANEAVLNMLNEIGDPSRIDEFVAKAKDKEDSFRLMGFGHRVYKNFDPRAKVMKQTADEVLTDLGLENEPLLEIAKRLEQIALEDSYFVERKLYPNVDFYSGIILKAIGIPAELFTCIFALGRGIGWIAHWNEMLSAPYKIGRPRQLYTGETQRDY